MELRAKIERLKDYYINIKKIGDEFSDDLNFINKFILDVDLSKDAKILDIGTGFGMMAIHLALLGHVVLTGEPEVDPERDAWSGSHAEHHGEHHVHSSFDWREIAREFEVADKIKFQYLNAEKLNFHDNSFDGIFMYDTLQHVQNKNAALKECVRILKSKGSIHVIETNEYGVKFYQENYGFRIDLIDPRDFISDMNLSTVIKAGKYITGYILRKL